MRKFKRVISGLLAGIMLSAVIAPFMDVITVHAATLTEMENEGTEDDDGNRLIFYEELCIGAPRMPDWHPVTWCDASISWDANNNSSTDSSAVEWAKGNNTTTNAQEFDTDYFADCDDFDDDNDAATNFVNFLKSIHTESSYSLSKINGIALSDLQSIIYETLDLPEGGESLLPVYNFVYKWEPTNANRSYITFIGCDYAYSIDRYIYYTATPGRYSGGKDSLFIMMFSSDDFFAPADEWRSDSDGKDVHDVTDMLYETDQDQYFVNLSNILNMLQKEPDGTNTFTAIATSGTITGDQKKRLIRIVDLLNYNSSSETIETTRKYGIMPAYNNEGDDLGEVTTHSLVSSTDWETDYVENYVLYSIDFEITVDFLAFGDPNSTNGSGFKVESASGNAGEDAIRAYACSILNGIANADVTSATMNADKIKQLLKGAHSTKLGEGTFIYEVIDTYAAKLDEAIEQSYVRQNAIDGTSLNISNSDGSFEIANKILIANIQAIANNTEWPTHIRVGDKIYSVPTDISGTTGNCDVEFKDLLNSLTDYQKAVLYTAYIGKLKAISGESSVNRLRYLNNYASLISTGLYNYSTLGPSGKPQEAEPDYVKALVEQYDESGLVNTGMVTNVARNSNILAHYVIASALYNTEATREDNDLYGVYNANLEALVKVQWTYKSESGKYQQDYFSHLPSKIGLLGDNSINYTVLLEKDENFDRLVNLLYNTEYAFSTLAFSELAEGQGWTPSQVASWLAGDTTRPDGVFSWMEASKGLSAYEQAASQESFNFNNDTDFSVNLFRCIIELHDMCEFLGIGKNDWSESIKTYLDIYDTYEPFFNALRSNPVIYSKIKQEPQSPTEPLAMFFSIQNKSVSDNWAKGFALSSTFVPMETNLYEASSVMFLNDAEWISEFYYKYAFYRKALYINTDNSAIVNNFVSGTTSGTRVATLNDLLNYERDIVLTIDDNFYNANEINSVIDAMDYTSMRNTANAEDTATGFKQVENCISDLMDLSADQILKTGSASYYSENLAKNVRKFGEAYESLDIYTNMVDCYVLSQDDLISDGNVFESYEYSPKVSYAVVSSIYRSADLYNESLKALASDNAIFKSSKAICTTPGTTSTNWRSIYNYAMLSNLSEQMKNDASSTLDLDAPIFCDLFGNIVTESGLVIIPAAANATLCGKYWTPYAVGFAEYYNNGNKLKVTDFSDAFNTWMIGRTYTTNPEGNAETNTIDTSKKTEKKNAGGFFEVDSNGNLVLKAQSITSGNISAIIQWDILNKNSSIVKQIFFNDAYFNKAANMYSPTVVNLMLETMRGAPIEDIDYTFEGLDGNQNISKYGVYMAYKLEELLDALMPSTNGSMTGGNSLVTMPNLAFMPGVEYIMLYAFKIIFAVLIVALVAQLYLDAVRNRIGFKSVGKFLMTCAMVILAFTVVPTLITWSYYKANKVLLNDETGRIAMLNYVKEFDGSEIGITQVTTPETQTELYLKLDDVSIEWWSIIPDVLFGNTYESVSDLYRKQATDHPYANNTNIITKGSGMYISVQDVFDSTDINYRPTSSMLTNTMYTYAPSGSGVVNSNAPVSYTMPYYVILDQLIANINEYNASRDITAYSWTIGANGHIMTYDVITPYLTSAEFLDDGMDILGMDRILVTGVNRPLYNFAFQGDFTDSGNPSGDLARMSKSLWYPTEKMDMNTRLYKVNELYDAARDYVADNKDVLGKVPDEVFIKVMALQLAIEYNKIFNVAYGNGIEIMNVDTRDLLRFMVADNANVYKYYSYSFARYTYEQSGGLGVIFSALLLAILWLTGFIKPLCMAIILGLLVVNCVFRKLLFKKESRCIEGYLIGCACLVLVNYAYALMLKVSMLINNIGLGSILSLSVGFIVQIVYVALLCLITYIEIKDWKNSGFNEFAVIGSNITSSIMKTQHLIVDKLMSKTSTSYKESAQSRAYSGDKYDSESIERMHQRDAEREDNGTYNPA